MIFSLLSSIQKRRTAARNFRVLSALDDEMLHDIGLDRRTLHAFCEKRLHAHARPAEPAGRALGGRDARPAGGRLR